MRTKAVAEGGGRGRAVGTEDQTEAEPLGLLVKLRLVLATTPTQGGYVTFRFCLCGFYTHFRFFQFFQHRPLQKPVIPMLRGQSWLSVNCTQKKGRSYSPTHVIVQTNLSYTTCILNISICISVINISPYFLHQIISYINL